MKKKYRKIITIILILIILFLVLYLFNIFNINHLINGISVNKETNDNIITTTTTGKDLSISKILKQYNLSIIENDKIRKNITIDNTKNKNKNITVEVDSTKSYQEIFDYFKKQYPDSISASNGNISTIITGDAENLIKITIEDYKYTFRIEQR